MREVPESKLDNAAATGNTLRLALQAARLHDRFVAASGPNPVRAEMLRSLSEAYIARGMAVQHRLAGSIQTALRLEDLSERRLADARRISRG